MKEIDLLPEWYKKDKKRKLDYRKQYALLAFCVVALFSVSFLLESTVSKASANLSSLKQRAKNARITAKGFEELNQEVEQLQKKANILDYINPRISISNVLAEISYLVDDNVAFNNLEFYAEILSQKYENKKNDKKYVVRLENKKANRKNISLFGDVRYKILVSGIAADAGNVADLICALDESPYFTQVTPLYSRHKMLNLTGNLRNEKLEITEFELRLYLANYQKKTKQKNG